MRGAALESRFCRQEKKEKHCNKKSPSTTNKDEHYYNKGPSSWFYAGEFVIRRNEASRIENDRKVGAKLGRPYRSQKQSRMPEELYDLTESNESGLERGPDLDFEILSEAMSFEPATSRLLTKFGGKCNTSRSSLGMHPLEEGQ
ncbi:hypothetical protein Tco_0276410 [Tanacetum coccineum]